MRRRNGPSILPRKRSDMTLYDTRVEQTQHTATGKYVTAGHAIRDRLEAEWLIGRMWNGWGWTIESMLAEGRRLSLAVREVPDHGRVHPISAVARLEEEIPSVGRE